MSTGLYLERKATTVKQFESAPESVIKITTHNNTDVALNFTVRSSGGTSDMRIIIPADTLLTLVEFLISTAKRSPAHKPPTKAKTVREAVEHLASLMEDD